MWPSSWALCWHHPDALVFKINAALIGSFLTPFYMFSELSSNVFYTSRYEKILEHRLIVPKPNCFGSKWVLDGSFRTNISRKLCGLFAHLSFTVCRLHAAFQVQGNCTHGMGDAAVITYVRFGCLVCLSLFCPCIVLFPPWLCPVVLSSS